MGQANFMDEMDCGSFFDHIDDLIDFPADDVVEGVSAAAATTANVTTAFNETNNAVNYAFLGDVWSAQCDSLPGSASDLSAELSVPYEDIVQLEWLSNFVEDSFSGGSLAMKKEECSSLNKNSSHHRFHTSSPVSVLESSSSCSGEKTSPRSPEVVAPGRCGRARSKRPRPATFTPRPAMQLISPTSSLMGSAQPMITPKRPFDCEGFAESRLIIKIPKSVGLEQKKKKKIKITVPAPPIQSDQDSSPQQAIRKCMHCEITKTPQWRAGPMGPKTLCNACGVRFKSGRLFPEYRPAASPTFVPALHSNSHKKVLEMRNKGDEKVPVAGGVAMIAKSEVLIPNNSNIPMDFI